jgi:hypothetical protein
LQVVAVAAEVTLMATVVVALVALVDTVLQLLARPLEEARLLNRFSP